MYENGEREANQQLLLQLKNIDLEELGALFRCEDSYLSSTSNKQLKWLSSRQAIWRPKIFEWFYKIIDHFEYDREVVAIAMDFLDRFQLLYLKTVDGEMYQRAAMASLYIAIKMNCNTINCTRRIFHLDEYAELSRGQFTAEDLTEMEMVICKTLKWRLNPIIPTYFLVELLSLFPHNTKESSSSTVAPRKRNHQNCYDIQFVLTIMYELARYLIEVAISSPDISFYLKYESSASKNISPRSVCYASVVLGMDMISEKYLPLESRNHFLKKSALIFQLDTHQINYQKKIIQHSFIPNTVLEGSLSRQEVSVEVDNLHPFAILREAGILCLESKQNLINSMVKETCGSKRKYPSSPTSLLDEDIF
jgi:hypothetical protein